MKPETEGKSAEEFWEERYEAQSGETSGKPTRSVETYVSGRAPGDALDLGCARGDDVVWLAKQGWQVLGVDIAEAALAHSAANAARNGVNNRIRLEQHDLAQSFPQGHFDLVTASFLQTPFEFPWENVIRQAAASIRAGGMLLTVTHQRVAPWSWQPPKQDLPGADELLARVDLDPDGWDRIFVGPVERIAKLPDGQSAEGPDSRGSDHARSGNLPVFWWEYHLRARAPNNGQDRNCEAESLIKAKPPTDDQRHLPLSVRLNTSWP